MVVVVANIAYCSLTKKVNNMMIKEEEKILLTIIFFLKSLFIITRSKNIIINLIYVYYLSIVKPQKDLLYSSN